MYMRIVFVACFLKHGEELRGSPLFLFSLLSKCTITRHIWEKRTVVQKTLSKEACKTPFCFV